MHFGKSKNQKILENSIVERVGGGRGGVGWDGGEGNNFFLSSSNMKQIFRTFRHSKQLILNQKFQTFIEGKNTEVLRTVPPFREWNSPT